MMSSTTPSKGVSTDINVFNHDPSYARDSVNGRFTNLGSNMTWESILPLKEYVHYHSATVLGVFDFQGYTYLLIIVDTYFKVIRYNESNETFTELFARLNSDFGFSASYPIRSCSFWVNVSETKLRIYFTDNNVNPWSIDLYDPLSVTAPIQDLSFSPRIGTPILDLYQVTNNGSLLCGKYYYAIQCYKQTGISTDWIMIHTPIEVPNKMPDDYTPSGYQSIEGGNSELKSRIAITLKLLNVTEFTGWYAKIAAFYAIDEFTIDTGRVFYDGLIGAGVFTHSANINLESVSVEIVKKNSLSIKKVGVITSNGEINVLGNIEINEMLPVQEGTFDNVKFFQRPTIVLKKYSNGLNTGIVSPIVLDKSTRADIWSYNNPIVIKPAQFSESVDANTATKLSPKTWKKNGTVSWNQDIKNYSPGFADYTNPHISFRNKVYRAGEPIRFALVPFDLYGKPMRPLWLNDLVETPNSTMVPSNQLSSESADGTNWLQRMNEGAFIMDEAVSASRLQLDFNWVEIYGIDLKDFQTNGVPNISGFSIVQAESPIKRISTEGFFTGISRISWGPNIVPSIGLIGERPPLAGAGWILLYSPDYFFNGVLPEAGDKIYATSKQTSVYADRIPEFAINGDYVWCHLTKTYYNKNLDSYAAVGTIEKVIELPNLPDTEKITVEGYGDVRNGGRGHEIGRGMGNKKGLLIKLKNEDGLYRFFETNETVKQNFIDYWTYRIENPGYEFASQQDSDLAKTVYNFIGHYQPVNTAFMTAIQNQGNYWCDAAVYGGQYYANIFEVMRLSRYLGTNGFTSQIVFMPVISRFNIRMRTGERYSKNRTLGLASGTTYINIDGIGIAEGRGKYEDFLFASSYLSKNIRKDLLPVSNDFILNTKINNVAYWSEKQSLQGYQDSFRKIYSDSYVICSLGGKDINGFEFLKDKLIVFQRQAIGFLPYNERMLANMSNNTNLIVSYGSIFPKYESIDTMNGIAHNLMKILTPNGIVFYNDYDKTLNVLGDTVDDFGRKLGILSLLKNQMINISKLCYSKDEKKIHILSNKKILEICLNPIIVNGIIDYDLATSLDIASIGSRSAIINKTGSGDSNTSYLYKEDSTGIIKLNSLYSLTVIIGSDRPDIFNKIFDNLIIHTSELLTPESIKFTAGSSSIEESILNNPNALINGSIIYTSIPFIPVSNTGGVKNTSRVGNNPICIVELKSTSRFNLNQIFCNYRSSK